MAMPCENSTEACAELAAATFEEVFDKSCQGISFFLLLLLNCLLERQVGSNPSGNQKLSSLQGNEVWQNLPVRAKVRAGEETTLLALEQKENQAQLLSGWENEHKPSVRAWPQ